MSEQDPTTVPTYNLATLPTPNVLGAPDSFVPKHNLLSKISRVGFGLLAAGTSLMTTEAETAEASSPMQLGVYCGSNEDGSQELVVDVYIAEGTDRDSRVNSSLSWSGGGISDTGYWYYGNSFGPSFYTGVLKAGSIHVVIDFIDGPNGHHEGNVQGKDCSVSTQPTTTTAPPPTTTTTEAPPPPPPPTTTSPPTTEARPQPTTTTTTAPNRPPTTRDGGDDESPRLGDAQTTVTTVPTTGQPSTTTAEANASSTSSTVVERPTTTTTTENNEVTIIDIDNDESDNTPNKSSNRRVAILGTLIVAAAAGVVTTVSKMRSVHQKHKIAHV